MFATAACGFSELSAIELEYCVRPSLQARHKYSGTQLMQDLLKDGRDPLGGEIQNDGSFKNFARMSSSDFELILINIGHTIAKQDTKFGYIYICKR